MRRNVFLIGLDGATFTVLDPLMERGVMPFLRDFIARGVRAPLRTIMPPLTPPAWTSLVTGLRPGRHGVFDFFQKESADSEYYALATSQDIQAPTIWSLASAAGRRVACLNFPLMFPPPDVNGWVVPGGWMPWRQLRLGCHPPGLFDELKGLPSFDPRELALDMELEAKAIEGCTADEHADWIRLHGRREKRWFDILRHLLAKDEPAELVAVMFDGPDKLQHLCWRFIDPASRPEHPEPWEQEVIDLCDDYFRDLDRMLEQVVELAGPEATVVLASDHGFGPTRKVFYVNQWLEQHGYLRWRDAEAGGSDAGAAPQVGFAQMTRHVHDLDWARTVAYAATPSSQGINLVRTPPDGSPGVPPERHDELLAEIAHRLRKEPLVLDVLTRTEAFAGPHAARAPDLSLVLVDGTAVSILRSDTLVREREQPNGNHRWRGILVASGPELRHGARCDEVSIVDVAPLVLHGLGVPVPEDLDGQLPAELFDPAALARRPVRHAPAAAPAAPVPAAVAPSDYDLEEEAAVVSRLRALGYLE